VTLVGAALWAVFGVAVLTCEIGAVIAIGQEGQATTGGIVVAAGLLLVCDVVAVSVIRYMNHVGD
jgi:ABC-type uncharacterized transport system permease subunit